MKPEYINGIFAIGGALIGVLGAWLISNKTKKTNRITIFCSPSSRLLDIEDLAKSDVEIKYKGNVIPALFHGEVAIQNTGTESLENVEAKLLPGDDSPLFDIELIATNFHKENNSIVLADCGNNSSIAKIDFLNPNDRIVIGYRSSGENEPNIACRKLGVDIELKEEAINWVPDIYAKLLFEILETTPFLSWYFKLAFKPYKLYLESKKKENA